MVDAHVLRTAIPIRAAVSDAGAKLLGKSTGYVARNVDTPVPDHSDLSESRAPFPDLMSNP